MMLALNPFQALPPESQKALATTCWAATAFLAAGAVALLFATNIGFLASILLSVSAITFSVALESTLNYNEISLGKKAAIQWAITAALIAASVALTFASPAFALIGACLFFYVATNFIHATFATIEYAINKEEPAPVAAPAHVWGPGRSLGDR